MKKLSFSQAQFVTSSLSQDTLPQLRTANGNPLPEIAVVGRSNVGKSSLINHLLKRRGLARVSATPGKTQTLNFFTVDEELALVDLPGYGYAKATDALKKEWACSIDGYLNDRPTLKLILFLLDSRRTPTEEDCSFAKWASHHELPILIIFTKADKLTENQKRINALNSLDFFKNYLHNTAVRFMHYSIKDARARIELIEKINSILTNS
jgi:GTP-binding protein